MLTNTNRIVVVKTHQRYCIAVYAKYGLDIHLDQLSFIPFESLLKEDFSKRKKGQFDYKPYITFGRYKLFTDDSKGHGQNHVNE